MNQETKPAFKKEIDGIQKDRVICVVDRLGAILGEQDAIEIFTGSRIVRIEKVDRDSDNLFVDLVVKLRI